MKSKVHTLALGVMAMISTGAIAETSNNNTSTRNMYITPNNQYITPQYQYQGFDESYVLPKKFEGTYYSEDQTRYGYSTTHTSQQANPASRYYYNNYYN